jgi:transglutaminase-like putative cysteine protease
MNIGIRYRATYQYAEPASFSPHLVRMFPRLDLFADVTRRAFDPPPSADVQYRRDLFDNLIGYCFFPDTINRLDFKIELEMRLTERDPFHFLLDSHALRVPFAYLPAEAEVLAPFLRRIDVGPLPQPLEPAAPRPTVEALVDMNRWIFENLDYERREDGPPRSPDDTLAASCGACRDFALLFSAVLRKHGIATRLASGYLWEPDTDEADQRAASALHAWVEAFLPGAGWVGLDPTNGIFCNHHFITAAVGLSPDDISPIKGSYYGRKHIESRMTHALEIVEL